MNYTDIGNGSLSSLFDCGPPPEVPYTFPTHLVMAIIHGIIVGIGMLGNALVIFVLLVAKDRQDTSSVTYVLNLAIADFLFLATVPFVIDQRIHLEWRSGEFMCKFALGFMTYLNFFVSPLFLMVMSIDRYLAVNKAVSATKLRNLKSSRLVSGIVWLVALMAVVPLAVLHTTDGGPIQKCKPRFPGQRPETNNVFFQRMEYEKCMCDFYMNLTLQTSQIEITNPATTMESSLPLIRSKREIYATTSPIATKSKKPKNKNRGRKNKRNRRKNKHKRNRFRRHKLDFRDSTTIPSFTTNLAEKRYLLPDLREPKDLNFVDFGESHLADFDTETIPSPVGIRESAVIRENGIWAPTESYSTSMSTGSTPSGLSMSTPSNPCMSQWGFNIFCAPPELQAKAHNACAEFYPNDTSRTNTCYHDEPYSFQVWTVLNFFYSYLIPCSVIVVCYMAILRKLYQPTGMIRSQESRGKIRRQAMRKKVTLMVAMLVLSYLMCFTPYYIFELMKVPGVPVSHMSTCYHISKMNTTLAYVNSALNPVLYTFLSDQFGSKLRLAWRRVTRKTAYHFGSVVRAGERRHIFVSSKNFSKRKPTKLSPRESAVLRKDINNCNGANRVVEDEKRFLEFQQNSDKNGNINSVTAPAEAGSVRKNSAKNTTNGPRQSIQSERQATPATDDVVEEPGELYQRSRIDSDRQKSKRKGSLFSCVADCTESDDEECPHCAMEMEQMVPEVQVYEEQNDETDDVTDCNDDVKNSVTTSASIATTALLEVPNKKGRKISTISVLSNQDTGYNSANSKLCRKHKRSVRSKSKDLDKDDSGKWVTASSFRSESKFPTEVTETSPI